MIFELGKRLNQAFSRFRRPTFIILVAAGGDEDDMCHDRLGLSLCVKSSIPCGPFFYAEQWADRVVDALRLPERFKPIRREARRFVMENFDADRICVPRMMSILEGDGLAGRSQRSRGSGRGGLARRQRRPTGRRASHCSASA